jgi:arginase
VGIVVVPYHLDEYLPGLASGFSGEVVGSGELAGADIWERLGGLYAEVASVVGTAVPGGGGSSGGVAAGPVYVISGDCTVSLATVAGLQRAGISPSIVWFDAHGDVQTLETTASGYVGGMPVRILCGYRPELISSAIGLSAVAESSVLLVDARDLDPPEAEYLASSAVRRCSVEEVSSSVLPDGPLVLHLDLDVVDGAALPGLRFPVSGGPSVEAVVEAARRVLDTGRVVAVDIACTWDPEVGDSGGVRAGLLAGLGV